MIGSREPERVSVSVVVPVYDRAGPLARALASVHAQTPLAPAEVVVVDDGSRDSSAAVAECHGAHVLRLDANRGPAAARNAGICAATSDWIAFLDSDDEWLPHHLATLWGLRGSHVLVADSALRCGLEPARDRVHGPPGEGTVVLRSPAKLLHPSNFVPLSGSMVRREVVLRAGGFAEGPSLAEDLDLWARVLDLGSGVVSSRVGVVYHEHGEQRSQDAPAMTEAHLAIIRSHAGRDWWSPALEERYLGTVEWDLLRSAPAGLRPRAFAAFAGALVRRPYRALGVAEMLLARFRTRRRSARVDRNGRAAVAVHSPVRRALVHPLGARTPRPEEGPPDGDREAL